MYAAFAANDEMTSASYSGTGDLGGSCESQDELFARAFDILLEGIREYAFPGAAVAVTLKGQLVALKAAGHYTYDPSSPKVRPDCIWDLASLTKVLATTAAGMVLYEGGIFTLEQPLAEVLPEFVSADASDERRQRVTLRMLLTHSSGLPSYCRMFDTARTPEELLASCYTVPLEADPGTRAEYSDIGFILLGEALVRLSKRDLASFCAANVFLPLGMNETAFRPRTELLPRIPPTGIHAAHPGRIIQGEVNDENAQVLGVRDPGHAGLFAPAIDVAKFADCMLKDGAPILRPETGAMFTKRETAPLGTSRALGWDTPSKPSQSGKYFSPRSFGHLGFTGTSLWCDPERQLSITLLTNRTWPDRGSQLIKRIRPRFHDAVIECMRLT